MDHVARVREALKGYRDSKEAMLVLATALYDARQAHASDQAFGLWLVENDLDEVNKNDRAALVKIAQYQDIARDVIAEGRVGAPQYVWAEIERRFPCDKESSRRQSVSAETPTPNSKFEPATSETSSTSEQTETQKPADPKRHQRSSLQTRPHGDLVLDHILGSDTRTMLTKAVAKRGGGEVWALLVESIQAGAFGPASSASVKTTNLRLVLPWAPVGFANRFDVAEAPSRTHIRQHIFPVVFAHRERLVHEPSMLPELVAESMQGKLEASKAKRDQLRRQLAATQLEARGEHPIIVYGTHLWPWIETTTAPWTYSEALEAAWFFRVIRPYLRQVGTPHEQAVAINIFLKWTPVRESGWAAAVRQIGKAYEKNPEGEFTVPPSPINFGIGRD